MHFFDLVNKRKSTRSFKGRMVSDEEVQQLLEAAKSAPSAGNLQAYEILAITKQGLKESLVEAAHGQKFIEQAPIVFAFLQDEERSRERYGDRGRLYSLQDGTIAATYLQLAAVELGLGSCWVGAFDEGVVKKLLDTAKRPLALIPVGYPARSSGKNAGRRELDELVEFVE